MKKDSLGWPLLGKTQKAFLGKHGYTVSLSAIGSEIAYQTFTDNQGRLQPREAHMARRILDELLPKGDPVYRASPWGKRASCQT